MARYFFDRPAILKQRRITKRRLHQALTHLDSIAVAMYKIQQFMAAHQDVKPGSKRDVEAALQLSQLRYNAGRMTHAEYVFYVSIEMEIIRNQRWSSGKYPEMVLLSKRMEKVETKHGLKEGEFWKLRNAPSEYKNLDKKLSVAMEKRLAETFKEFGFEQLGKLIKSYPDEFDRLREVGRRRVFSQDNLAEAVEQLTLKYEEEAYRASKANAHSSAVFSIASCLEGILLLQCLKQKAKALEVGSMIARKPQVLNDMLKWGLERLIRVNVAAGWVTSIDCENVIIEGNSLMDEVRRLRNLTHPGRVIRMAPWLEIGAEEFKRADAIYVVIKDQLKLLEKKTN